MKKIAIITMFILAVTVAAKAQFTVGVKAGLNESRLHFSRIDELNVDIKWKSGLLVGGFLNYQINDLFDAQIEAQYSQQGVREDCPLVDIGGYEIGDAKAKYTLGYINIPLLVRYYIAGSKLYAEAGPQLGIYIDDKFSVSDDDVTIITHKTNLEHKPLDFALVGGIGYRLNYGLSISARYCHSFIDSYKIENMSPRNRTIQLSIAYDIKTF